MSFDTLLDRSVDIQRATITQAATGGTSHSWANIYNTVPMRIEQLSSTERAMSGREGIEATHRGYLKTGYTMSAKDRVRDGTTFYDIESVIEAKGFSAVHHIELLLVLRS